MKLKTVLYAVLLLLFLTACSTGEATKNESPSSKETETEPSTEEQSRFQTNEDLKAELESEENIEDVMIQVVKEEQRVNIDITIAPQQQVNVSDIITTYGERVQEVYPDYSIDMIVVQDGKVLDQQLIE